VRGLDYYNGVAFEVKVDDQRLGRSQNTVLAGGRYDYLSEAFCNAVVPAVGWAAGVDRMAMLLDLDQRD
jgi:histidyl-tRNA synthetase